MRNDLLSIGEVSKLKGVGVKALRYYERIGILDPAYVNPHTGYRYYALRQMTEIDVIASCVDLGIPLKELRGYRSEGGSLDVLALLERGHEMAEEKLRAARATLAVVDSYRSEIGVQETFRCAPEPYRRDFAPGTVLLARWGRNDFEARRYTQIMTSLYQCAKRFGLPPLFPQGLALLPDDGGYPSGWYAMLAVEASVEMRLEGGEGAKGIRLATLPAGVFEGRRIEACFEQSYKAAFEETLLLKGKHLPVFILEVWDARIQAERCVVELLTCVGQ